MKELGRLEAQLAGLRQELAALTLEQSSVADQVGLLPQQLQAMRDDVSWNCPRLLLDALGSETICPRSLRGAGPLSLQLVSPTSPGLGLGTRLPVTGVLLLITWRAVHSSFLHVALIGLHSSLAPLPKPGTVPAGLP